MFFAWVHHPIVLGSIEGDSANSATRDKGGSKQFKTSSLQNHAVFPSQQWSDPCDTSLAVESALCTTGSTQRWCQRVSWILCLSSSPYIIIALGSVEGDSANSDTRDKGGSKQFKTWGRGWMTKASGVGERREDVASVSAGKCRWRCRVKP